MMEGCLDPCRLGLVSRLKSLWRNVDGITCGTSSQGTRPRPCESRTLLSLTLSRISRQCKRQRKLVPGSWHARRTEEDETQLNLVAPPKRLQAPALSSIVQLPTSQPHQTSQAGLQTCTHRHMKCLMTSRHDGAITQALNSKT